MNFYNTLDYSGIKALIHNFNDIPFINQHKAASQIKRSCDNLKLNKPFIVEESNNILNFLDSNYVTVNTNVVNDIIVCENGFNFIDVSTDELFLKHSTPVNESFDIISDTLHPIYIVLVHTASLVGYVIRFYTRSLYSHAALSLDSILDKMYSFDGNNERKLTGGFAIQSLKKYAIPGKTSFLCVYTTFIDSIQFNRLRDKIDDFITNTLKTNYGYANLLGVLIGRPIGEANNMICSQFVNEMLKFVGIDATDGKKKIPTPGDFGRLMNKNIYKVFEGNTSDYDHKVVDKKVNKLLKMGDNLKPFKNYSQEIESDEKYNNILNTLKFKFNIIPYKHVTESFNNVSTVNNEIDLFKIKSGLYKMGVNPNNLKIYPDENIVSINETSYNINKIDDNTFKLVNADNTITVHIPVNNVNISIHDLLDGM